MRHPAVNFSVYQLTWFALVISAGAGRAWLGVAVGVAAVSAHLWVEESGRDLRLVVTSLAIGFVVETSLLAGEVLRYQPTPSATPWLPPVWILTLWAAFAITLRHSLRWLQRHLGVAAAAGAIFGPVAFRAGEAFGAVVFPPDRGTSYLALSVAWGTALPILMAMARRAEASVSTE
ncbi:MAG: DUF2878 domain-containing protein [Gemmatimonadetes bacterium]|nr:DUF2878 domain-containing protein [Gemmatimonadota bacterium]